MSVKGSVPGEVRSAHRTRASCPYRFDLGGRRRDLTAAQHPLANAMIDYRARFARCTADPNGPSSPRWPQHAVLSLAPDRIVPISTAQVRHHCAFWDALG
ncbi:hypothetical protein [Streptomyces sp. N2A]|uniref:hypothetical protein n=1 Tax=Streptomyces sp. N2A TaxID=3073936 RepID=UPI0028704CAE|nr:hypothetical protein [Streptomyces sp. N2A]